MTPRGEGFGKLGIRVTSALVFGVVVLGVILFGGVVGLGLLLATAGGLAASEAARLLPHSRSRTPVAAGGATVAILLAATAGAWSFGSIGALVLTSAGIALLLLVSMTFLATQHDSTAEDSAAVVLSALWVGFGLAHLVFLRGVESGGQPLALLTVLGVWAGDVAAYLVGIAIGRHKLAPRVSPNKSWEGFTAGLAATVAVWAVLGPLLRVPLGVVAFAAIGALAAAAGLIGDLAESRLKRLAGVKDSGSIIPGHGGVFDRFDSLILVSVVIFWAVSIGGLA